METLQKRHPGFDKKREPLSEKHLVFDGQFNEREMRQSGFQFFDILFPEGFIHL